MRIKSLHIPLTMSLGLRIYRFNREPRGCEFDRGGLDGDVMDTVFLELWFCAALVFHHSSFNLPPIHPPALWKFKLSMLSRCTFIGFSDISTCEINRMIQHQTNALWSPPKELLLPLQCLTWKQSRAINRNIYFWSELIRTQHTRSLFSKQPSITSNYVNIGWFCTSWDFHPMPTFNGSSGILYAAR